VILTEVDAVYRRWGTDEQEDVRQLNASAFEELLPQLAAGSIAPKVEASVEFAKATGRDALITSAVALSDALANRAGTRVTAS
jgi:carbamate kinase